MASKPKVPPPPAVSPERDRPAEVTDIVLGGEGEAGGDASGVRKRGKRSLSRPTGASVGVNV